MKNPFFLPKRSEVSHCYTSCSPKSCSCVKKTGSSNPEVSLFSNQRKNLSDKYSNIVHLSRNKLPNYDEHANRHIVKLAGLSSEQSMQYLSRVILDRI